MPGSSPSQFWASHAVPFQSHNYDIIQVWSSAFFPKDESFKDELLDTEDKEGGGVGPKELLHIVEVNVTHTCF